MLIMLILFGLVCRDATDVTLQDGGAEERRDLQWSVGLLRWFHEPVPCPSVPSIFGHRNVVISSFV